MQKQSPQLLIEAFASFMQVIQGKGALPESLALDDEQLINWGRKIDRLYQSAASYKLLIPHLDYHRARRSRDVRGLLYLQKNQITDRELAQYDQWANDKKQTVRQALIGLCVNSQQTVADCEKEWPSNGPNSAGAVQFYQRYFGLANTLMRSFLIFPSLRPAPIWPGPIPTRQLRESLFKFLANLAFSPTCRII